jgi:hypothetical protein
MFRGPLARPLSESIVTQERDIARTPWREWPIGLADRNRAWRLKDDEAGKTTDRATEVISRRPALFDARLVDAELDRTALYRTIVRSL